MTSTGHRAVQAQTWVRRSTCCGISSQCGWLFPPISSLDLQLNCPSADCSFIFVPNTTTLISAMCPSTIISPPDPPEPSSVCNHKLYKVYIQCTTLLFQTAILLCYPSPKGTSLQGHLFLMHQTVSKSNVMEMSG